MFFEGGSYNTIDDKGRLVIPAKFRDDLGQRFVLVRGVDTCISIYTAEQFEKVRSSLSSMNQFDKNARRLVRHIIGCKQEAECDKQGRILLDQDLRKYAHLTKDVFITGVVDRVEIWDVDEYEKYERENEDADNDEGVTLEDAVQKIVY